MDNDVIVGIDYEETSEQFEDRIVAAIESRLEELRDRA